MSAPPASAPISEDAFRVVFFGPPGAGKTALLAVLGMAQEQQLQGRLIDVTQGLAGLRKAVGQPAPDGAPPLALPVTFEPLPSPPNGKGPSASAVLIDCPGKAAAELLANPWQAHARVIDDGIAGEVLLADVLFCRSTPRQRRNSSMRISSRSASSCAPGSAARPAPRHRGTAGVPRADQVRPPCPTDRHAHGLDRTHRGAETRRGRTVPGLSHA